MYLPVEMYLSYIDSLNSLYMNNFFFPFSKPDPIIRMGYRRDYFIGLLECSTLIPTAKSFLWHINSIMTSGNISFSLRDFFPNQMHPTWTLKTNHISLFYSGIIEAIFSLKSVCTNESLLRLGITFKGLEIPEALSKLCVKPLA